MCEEIVYKYDPVNAIMIVEIKCMSIWEDSKKLIFNFKKKPVLDLLQTESFKFDTCSILEKNQSDFDFNIREILKEFLLKKNIRILVLNYFVDSSLFINKAFDLNDPLNKSVPGLACKEGGLTCEELKSSLKTFAKTMQGPSQEKKTSFQMPSPMFSNLVMTYANESSPSSNCTQCRNVKRFVPKGEQDGKLVQFPRSFLFAVLGWSGSTPTVTIEAYDPQARKWFYVSQDGFIKRAYHGVVMVGVLIYVIGGFDGRMCFNSVFCFNVETRRWYRRSSLNIPRCYVTALAHRGLVYAMGGYDGDERFRSCERFDPVSRKWSYFASMNDRRSDASGTVHKGKIFMCGGFNGTHVLSTTEIYDPEQNQWTLVANTLSPRSGHVLVSYKSVLLAIGGYDGDARLRTVERFDDDCDEWHDHSTMLDPRSNFAAAVLEEKLYVIAGYDGNNTFAKVERYDDVTKGWQMSRSLNKHRSAHGACVFNDSMTVSMCTVKGHITVRTANVEQTTP